MKRVAVIPIVLALLFTFSGCNKAPEPTVQVPAPTPVVQPTPTPQPVEEPDDGLPVIDIKGKVTRISTSPDFRLLALQTEMEYGAQPELIIYDVKQQKMVNRTSGVGAGEWSPDSKRLLTGDSHGLVVLEMSGKMSHFRPMRRYFECAFRTGSSSKLLYFNYGTEEIWELDLRTKREKKIRRISGPKSGFTGFTQFRGQDVYGEYRHEALRVRSVRTNKVLFRIPLVREYPFAQIGLKFSPDSKWFSFLDNEGSGGDFLVVNVDYANVFLQRKYLASFASPYDDERYSIQWAPKPAESEWESDALITRHASTPPLVSAINVESGRMHLRNYPAAMSWWGHSGERLAQVAAKKDGIYYGIFDQNDPINRSTESGPRMIAHFRMDGKIVKAEEPESESEKWENTGEP